MIRYLLALLLLVSTAAAAAPSAHEAWVRAALDRAPVSKRDNTPERLERHATNKAAFAREIARVSERAPLDAKVWAALIVAQGSVETNFDTEVVAGRCLRFQCDPKLIKGGRIHQSVGAFQQQRVAYVTDIWSPTPSIADQVEMADRTLRRSLARCKSAAPFPAHVFRAYGGARSCSWPAPREAERVAVYQRAMRVVVKGGAS